MRQLWKRRLVRRMTYAMLVIAALLSTGASYFGIWGRDDLIAYYGMSKECHPVWKDLALHRVYHGQPIDEVIERTNPVCVTRHGRFVQLDYQDGFRSLASRSWRLTVGLSEDWLRVVVLSTHSSTQ